MPTSSRKATIAALFDILGGLRIGLAIQKLVLRGGFIRVVNFHDVPPDSASRFENFLDEALENFRPAGPGDIESLCSGQPWSGPRPGLALTFDDGFRSFHSIVAPRLQARNWPAWFFIPTDFVDTPPDRQVEFAATHAINSKFVPPDRRIALDWNEIRDLDRLHVIGSHTRSHRRLRPEVSPAELDDEVNCSRSILEERLGHAVDAFCWVGGDEPSYTREAAAAIRRADYRYGFTCNNFPVMAGSDPLEINRTNIEAYWDPRLVRFQLSGVLDILYSGKRRRVRKILAAGLD